jgi:ligand-binding sensor domain-containing protein
MFPMLGLVFTVLVFASCSPSVKPTLHGPGIAVPVPTTKLKRTQGSDQYAEVKCGLLDRLGNLWFGTTDEGVYRYDGRGFTQYTVADGLSSNTVWSILEDRRGGIWFGTDSGLCRLDGTRIRRVPLAPHSDGPMPGAPSTQEAFIGQAAVWSLLEDSSGTIWIGAGEGVLCLKGDSISPFLANPKVQNPSGLQLKMVEDMLEDRQGNIWFASGMPPGMEGLCRFDGTAIKQFNPGGAKWIRAVNEDSRGHLWLGTRSDGLWHFDGETFTHHAEPVGLGTPLLVDRSGSIWFSGEEQDNGFASKAGIWRAVGKSFQNFSTPEGMGEFFAWCAVEDRDGNIWVGTRNTGLYRYDGRSFICMSE